MKSSGLRWSECFTDVLRAEGFFPSRAEMDIWMREKNGLYEYVDVYVDNLLLIGKAPQDTIDMLETR